MTRVWGALYRVSSKKNVTIMAKKGSIVYTVLDKNDLKKLLYVFRIT